MTPFNFVDEDKSSLLSIGVNVPSKVVGVIDGKLCDAATPGSQVWFKFTCLVTISSDPTLVVSACIIVQAECNDNVVNSISWYEVRNDELIGYENVNKSSKIVFGGGVKKIIDGMIASQFD